MVRLSATGRVLSCLRPFAATSVGQFLTADDKADSVPEREGPVGFSGEESGPRVQAKTIVPIAGGPGGSNPSLGRMRTQGNLPFLGCH